MQKGKWLLITFCGFFQLLRAQLIQMPAGAMGNISLNRGHYIDPRFNPINQIGCFSDSVKYSFAAHFTLINKIPEFKQNDFALILGSKKFNYSIYLRQNGIPNLNVFQGGLGLTQQINPKLSYGWSFSCISYQTLYYPNQFGFNANVACNYKISKHLELYSELILPIDIQSNKTEYDVPKEPVMCFSTQYKIQSQLSLIASYAGYYKYDKLTIVVQKSFSKGLKACFGLHVKTSEVAFGVSMRLHQFEISTAAVSKQHFGLSEHLSSSYVKKH